ncbi:hypothetical protein LJR219_004996 [Phenylobacterium sp. LjRoot219]|uniref:hypothetical protein n=1 Tax=Phenylobacterium sp. LjRoot219 TaxID=3342283 RepID=UPI003ECDACB7
MALSLHDHERRIEDLEIAFDALRRIVIEAGEREKAAVAEAIRKLRVGGRSGAATLLQGLEGARLAPYRT